MDQIAESRKIERENARSHRQLGLPVDEDDNAYRLSPGSIGQLAWLERNVGLQTEGRYVQVQEKIGYSFLEWDFHASCKP
jgi:hypothetical protein